MFCFWYSKFTESEIKRTYVFFFDQLCVKNMEGSCLRIGLSDWIDYLTFLRGLPYILSLSHSFCIFLCSEPIKQATQILQFGSTCLQYLVQSLAIFGSIFGKVYVVKYLATFGQICGLKPNKGKRTNLAVHWFPLTLAGHWSGQMFLGLDTHRQKWCRPDQSDRHCRRFLSPNDGPSWEEDNL